VRTLNKWMQRVFVGTGLFGAAMILTLSIRNRSLPAAPEHAFVPSPKGVPKMRVCWIEFDHNVAPGWAATAGFTRMKEWELTGSGLLIEHPKGEILIDVGNSSHFQDEISGYPFWSHLHFEILTGGKSAAHKSSEVLRAAGIDPGSLAAVLPSHIHMDHAGGLVDLPNVPVLLSQDEIDFMERNRYTKTIQVVPAQARAMEGRVRALNFQHKLYESFDESADLFGDGSIVVVKLPGHTPGSVGTFVNLSPTFRIFHVGDAVNVSEAVDRRLAKSFIMATTDNSIRDTNLTVAKLAQLHALDPDLLIVPAHDRGAWKRVFGSTPGCIP
jgi:N-acyl homoserine lactone hydrolase